MTLLPADNVADLLRSKGLKVTPQRVAIYKYLASTRKHPTAESVYEAVLREFPAISFNTVYTTLRTFQDAGLARRLVVGESIYRYDADIAPHAHFACTKCGRVDDLDGSLTETVHELERRAREQLPHSVAGTEVTIFGLCPRCRQEE